LTPVTLTFDAATYGTATAVNLTEVAVDVPTVGIHNLAEAVKRKHDKRMLMKAFVDLSQPASAGKKIKVNDKFFNLLEKQIENLGW
jgi:hypothetical protein